MATARNKKLTLDRYKCPVCGESFTKQTGYFFKTKDANYIKNNGYITICKSCLQKMFEQYIKFYDSIPKAIRHICIMFGYYYSENGVRDLEASLAPKIGDYIKSINNIKKTYLDTILEEHDKKTQQGAINALKEEEADKIKVDQEIDDEVKFFFGDGFTYNDYEFLVTDFNEWKKRIGENLTKSEEGLLRNIVFNELDMMKARQNGESTKDLEATYLNNLKAGGWSPNQNTEDTTGLDCFGKWINRIEDNDPIPDPDPEWEDVDNIKDYIDAFYKIPTAESIGLKTFDKSDAYNRLMKKYSITVKENDNDEENDELFDKALGVVNEE